MRRHAKASFAGSTQGSGTRRGFYGLVCLCVLGLAAFLGSSASSAGAQACPNLRNGPSVYLPNCRAYEMASPPEKEGLQVLIVPNPTSFAKPPVASQDGAATVFNSQGAWGESASNGLVNTYLARRSASAWNSENISAPLGTKPESTTTLNSTGFFGYSQDLETGLLVGGIEPPLTPGASSETGNLYVRDNSSGAYRLASLGAPAGEGELGWDPTDALSDDGSHAIFGAPFELTGCGGAPAASPYLCDFSAATGTLALVGRAPVTNEVLAGAVQLAGPGGSQAWRRLVSADGSRIFFEGGGEGCGVCVRINGVATQIVSETGTFQIASSDGTVAYVTDGGDLLRWDGGLTNLTGGGGEVKGVLGASADGSRVYFVAGKELAPGATAGENNLYLWTQGVGFQFIATGNGSGVFTGNYATEGASTSRVTPDGMHVAFTANNSLTGYPDGGNSEAYLYRAATGELVCASCNPSGEPATSGSFIDGGSSILATESRNLSDDGAYLFFDTEEALVPRDHNGQRDVYEYDAASGAVALISTGNSAAPSFFSDAGASGIDAFFGTLEQLVGIDKDQVYDVYDARVDGGLASQHPSSAPPCTGDECRGQSSSPDLAAPASAGFVGKGNVSQKQNCNKLGREAKKLSNRAKRLRKNAKAAQRNGKSAVAKQRNRKATRLAKRARNKSKSAKRCRKANRRASK